MPRASIAAFLVIVLALLVSGCGKKIEGVCQEKCSGDGVEVCQEATEQSEALAEERGCELAFEEYAECLGENATCTEGVLDAPAACDAQAAELAACMQ